jgi:prepilin-type N-terminal cleavage/methylation domain-containing protein
MGMLTLKTERGFTFLEVMIALSIVALVLVAAFQLQSQNIALGVRARFNATAPMLANMKLSEIISDTESIVMSSSGDFGESFVGYHWQAEVADVESDLLGETANRLKKIDIYVEAEDSGVAYQLQTYFFFDEEP